MEEEEVKCCFRLYSASPMPMPCPPYSPRLQRWTKTWSLIVCLAFSASIVQMGSMSQTHQRPNEAFSGAGAGAGAGGAPSPPSSDIIAALRCLTLRLSSRRRRQQAWRSRVSESGPPSQMPPMGHGCTCSRGVCAFGSKEAAQKQAS